MNPPARGGLSRRQFLRLGAAVAVVGPLLDACSSSSSPKASPNPTTGAASTVPRVNADRTAILQFGEMQGQSYDPIRMVAVEYEQLNALFDTLTSYNPTTGALEPRLATSWEIASERVRLHLRPGVTFQDGTPFNAQAVKFSLERVLSDPASNIKTGVKMLGGVTVVDDMTADLMLNTNAPQPLLYQLADRPGMIVSPTAVQKAGSSDKFSQAPVGAGMYAISGSWFPREKMSVRAWPGYWDKSAQLLGGVDFTNLLEAARVNALRAGASDLCDGLIGTDVAALKADPSLRVKIGPGAYNYGLTINITQKPLDNILVRQAISYAIDRVGVNQALAKGLGVPAYQFAVPASPAYDASLDTTYVYNPTKAKQLLAQAGYPNGVSFKSIVGATAAVFVQFGELVQSQLKQVGITMDLQLVNQALTTPMLFRDGGHGTAQSAAYAGGIPVANVDLALRNALLPEGATNAGGVEVPGVRALLDQAAAAPDTATATKLYQQINKIVTEGVYAMIPVYTGPAISGYHNYVGGPVVASADGNMTPDLLRGVYISTGKSAVS
jgi:ABC-type transport system substrate-binding protein